MKIGDIVLNSIRKILLFLLLFIIAALATSNIEVLTQKYGWNNFLVIAIESAISPIKAIVNNSWFLASFWFMFGATTMAWLSYFIGQSKPKNMSLTHSRNEENETQIKPNPFDTLVQECKSSDATHIKLTRKPEVFMWIWVYYLDKLRKERNTHDTVNLFNIIGTYIHAPGNGSANVGMDEVLYTIKCLGNRGYISLEKSDHGHCTAYDNNNIKYNAKYDELIKGVNFYNDGNKLSMSLQ